MVGAALDSGVAAGLIADLVHVSAPAIGVAARAKSGPGRLFLVTDAMAVAGTDLSHFTLNGRTIERRDGHLTLSDGTLAGADITLPQAISNMHRHVGLTRAQALAMATRAPAEAVGLARDIGHLNPGAPADFVYLSDDLSRVLGGVNTNP
ncbi:hypothetical protein DT23_17565 [Thioclava indica]|uniref:Amidohydrolase-related domain-containing protein n=1 Tax=Thioclava indica TaxID=1353528 RepID=A0A074JMG4_9RHOB|nr:hypothetical protein DT23_17565 [Thioclava indica]